MWHSRTVFLARGLWDNSSGKIDSSTALFAAMVLLCCTVYSGAGNVPSLANMLFVWKLQRVRDLQLRVRGMVNHQTAAELGLAPSFRDAMESGRFSFVAMKRRLTACMQGLDQVLLCVLISWLLCVVGGLCLTL